MTYEPLFEIHLESTRLLLLWSTAHKKPLYTTTTMKNGPLGQRTYFFYNVHMMLEKTLDSDNAIKI